MRVYYLVHFCIFYSTCHYIYTIYHIPMRCTLFISNQVPSSLHITPSVFSFSGTGGRELWACCKVVWLMVMVYGGQLCDMIGGFVMMIIVECWRDTVMYAQVSQFLILVTHGGVCQGF